MFRSRSHHEDKQLRMRFFFSAYSAGNHAFCQPIFVRIQAWASGDVTHSVLKSGLRVVIVRNALASVVTTGVHYLLGRMKTHRDFQQCP